MRLPGADLPDTERPGRTAGGSAAAAWPGVDPRWSRFVDVPSTAAVDPSGTTHTWHLLDNGPQLAARGLSPAGTLLCVHGNPTWSYLWRSVLAAATDAAHPWRVIAVDQLEMGFSERTGRMRRLADRITDLGDLTDALGLSSAADPPEEHIPAHDGGPVITVGHDWGGAISLGWAARHQDRLGAVVLTNTAIHQPAGTRVPAALRLALHPIVHRWGTVTSTAFLRITHALAQPRLEPAVREAFMAPYRRAPRRTGIADFVADIPIGPSHPSYPELGTVAEAVRGLRVPALLLWGPKDPIFSDRYLRDLIERLPQAGVHRFEGAGHLLPEDVDVAATILDWLDLTFPAGTAVAEAAAATAAATAGAATAAATAGAAKTVDTAYRPMWAELDRRVTDPGTAVVDMGPSGPVKTLSWAQLAKRVRDLADGLLACGVTRGDRVNLLVPPGSELTCLIYACLRIGAVIVVADAGLGTKGLSRAIKGAGPAHIIGIERALVAARAFNWPGRRISVETLPPVRAKLLGIALSVPEILARGAGGRGTGTAATGASSGPAAGPNSGPRSAPDSGPQSAPGPDDDAAVLFTSGSTGPAKGVVYSYRQLAAMRDTLAVTYGLRTGTALVAGFAPFALLGPALGATSVTPDMDVTSPKTLTAAALAEAAAAIDAGTVFASPSAMSNIVRTAGTLNARQRKALAKVTLMLSAGAPISESLLAKVSELVPQASLHTPYGMTEALPITDIDLAGIRAAAADARAHEHPATKTMPAVITGAGNGVCVGFPVPGASVAISKLDGLGAATGEPTTEPGVTGEILVSAAHVKSRYDRLWATQRAGSRNPGRHRTGDTGHLDARGRLWVEGRLAHTITTAAGPATPVAGEQLIETVAGVGRAAVVGVGPAGTQVPVAVVETYPPARRPDLAGRRLTTDVRAAAAASGLVIAAVLVVAELPTDIRHNSKIDRARLARWAATVLAGGRMSPP